MPFVLSRIVADYAVIRPKWDAACPHVKDKRLALRAERCAVERSAEPAKTFVWAASDLSIGQFPCGTKAHADGKTPAASLRVWTIRIDRAADSVSLGIAEDHTTHGETGARWTPQSLCLSTHSPYVFGAPIDLDIGLPYNRSDAAGALYHFTADLHTGHVRVRPVLTSVGPHPRGSTALVTAGQTEWTLTRTALSTAALTNCRVYVAMVCSDSACTMLFE
jgi:hypothetical protein